LIHLFRRFIELIDGWFLSRGFLASGLRRCKNFFGSAAGWPHLPSVHRQARRRAELIAPAVIASSPNSATLKTALEEAGKAMDAGQAAAKRIAWIDAGARPKCS